MNTTEKDRPEEGTTCTLSRRLNAEEGYTLTELMIVLVVIGVLTLIALPRFMGVATRAKMTEAQTQLKHLHMLQQAHVYERDVYGATLAGIGFEQSALVTENGNARYTIAVERADASGYTATATAVVDFDKDGTFNVWEVDETGEVRQRTPD